MSKIEAVIFDVGGVLHKSFWGVMEDVGRELGLEWEALKKIWATEIPLLGSGKIDEAEFWKRVHADYAVRHVETDENLLGRAFREALTPYREMAKLVRDLRAKGLKVAILSNTIEPHARANRAAGVYDGFDHVLLSHEIGLRKQDPLIYWKALQVLGVKPEAVIFIDDTVQNVQAAQGLGIHGIHFNTPEQAIVEVYNLISEHGNS